MFFADDYLKNFHLEVLGFLSSKLSTVDHFTIVKGSICCCFGPRSCLNQVKSPIFCLIQIMENPASEKCSFKQFSVSFLL